MYSGLIGVELLILIIMKLHLEISSLLFIINLKTWINLSHWRRYINDYINDLIPPKLILAGDRSLVIAMASVTQPVDGDNLARCLVYLFEPHALNSDIIKNLIDIEVATCN